MYYFNQIPLKDQVILLSDFSVLFVISIFSLLILETILQFAGGNAIRGAILLACVSFGILAWHFALPLRIVTHYSAKEYNYSWPFSFMEHVCQLNCS